MIYNLKVQKQGELCLLNLEILVKNTIVITLSDPLDPIFLAQIHLTPTLFGELVKEQDLRMEYDQFIDQFKILLGKEDWTKIFDDDNNFKLVEITSWRALCHLKLKMEIPSLQVKNQYISDKLVREKEEHFKLKDKLKSVESNLQTEIRSYSLKVKELQELLSNTNKNTIESKDRYQQELSDVKKQHELELSNLHDKLNAALSASNKDHSKLQHDNDSLKVQLNALQRQNTSLENELQRIQQESSKYFQQQQQTSTEYNNLQNQLGLSKNRISILEEEIKHKLTLIHKLESDLQAEQQDKHMLNNKVNELDHHIKSISNSVSNTNLEVNKGNDIISELENEVKNQKNKLKLSTQLALTQEGKINELNNELRAIKNKYNHVSDAHERTEMEFDQIEHDNVNLQKKLNFAHNRLETKNGTYN